MITSSFLSLLLKLVSTHVWNQYCDCFIFKVAEENILYTHFLVFTAGLQKTANLRTKLEFCAVHWSTVPTKSNESFFPNNYEGHEPNSEKRNLREISVDGYRVPFYDSSFGNIGKKNAVKISLSSSPTLVAGIGHPVSCYYIYVCWSFSSNPLNSIHLPVRSLSII